MSATTLTATLGRLGSVASILLNDVSALSQSVPTTGAFKISNVPYVPNGHARQRLDVYIPSALPFPRPLSPCLLFVPGGGWVRGSKDGSERQNLVTHRLYANVGYTLASLGVTTFICDYRLSPEVQHPGHLHDVQAAVGWVASHARAYGGDPTSLVLSGHSAGAHLVALALCAPPSPLLSSVRAFVGMCGVYDVHRLASAPLGGTLVHTVFGGPDAWTAASPVHALSARSALVAGGGIPTLLLNAEEDMHLAEDGADFEAALRALRGGRGTVDPASGRAGGAAPPLRPTEPGGRPRDAPVVWHSPSPFDPTFDGVSRCTIPRTGHMSVVARFGAHEEVTRLLAGVVASTARTARQRALVRSLMPVVVGAA